MATAQILEYHKNYLNLHLIYTLFKEEKNITEIVKNFIFINKILTLLLLHQISETSQYAYNFTYNIYNFLYPSQL